MGFGFVERQATKPRFVFLGETGRCFLKGQPPRLGWVLLVSLPCTGHGFTFQWLATLRHPCLRVAAYLCAPFLKESGVVPREVNRNPAVLGLHHSAIARCFMFAPSSMPRMRIILRVCKGALQQTWSCTDPLRKTTFLLERQPMNSHVSWKGVCLGQTCGSGPFSCGDLGIKVGHAEDRQLLHSQVRGHKHGDLDSRALATDSASLLLRYRVWLL